MGIVIIVSLGCTTPLAELVVMMRRALSFEPEGGVVLQTVC